MSTSNFKGIRNVSGRPKGAVNKNTATTKAVIQKLVTSELAGLPELMNALKPKERAEILVKLLPFIIPKQTEISIDAPIHQLQPITLNLIEEPLKLTENGKNEN
nr:hypothetical protein [Flavobacterium sp.]